MTIISKNELYTNNICRNAFRLTITESQTGVDFCESMEFQKKYHNFMITMIFEKCQNCSMGFARAFSFSIVLKSVTLG